MGATRRPTEQKQLLAAYIASIPKAPDGESSMALETGNVIAWVRKDSQTKATVGVSAIHRVFSAGETYCRKPIPPEPQRFPPLPSLTICSRCAQLYERAKKYEDAAAERMRISA